MMTFDQLNELARNRHSVRYFSDEPVPKETVLQLIEFAMQAPNIENLQPWQFHVVYNKELMAGLSESVCYGNFVMGAGAFIVVSCDKGASETKQVIWNPREIDYSCVAAMSYFMLGATSMGLGSCWVSLHHGAPHELLKLPKSHIVIGGLMLGHLKDADTKKKNVSHERKNAKEVVKIYE